MKNNKHLSIVLATHNEEENIANCLQSVRSIADEIVIVDGSSTDKTREIAKRFGARVFKRSNPKNFHINKQIALQKARGDWILQLDADEIVTPELASEISAVVLGTNQETNKYYEPQKEKLFKRHQKIIEERW